MEGKLLNILRLDDDTVDVMNVRRAFGNGKISCSSVRGANKKLALSNMTE